MLADRLSILLERKVTGIQQMHLAVWQIVLERLCTAGSKDRIILAPHSQQRRLVLPEVLMPLRIERRIGAIVLEKGQLDLSIAWTIQSQLIKRPGIGTDLVFLAHPMGILPDCFLSCEQASDRFLCFSFAIGPERP